jgi:NAD(P)-dependent dehydrogenase (short-subunit alcohol dehydrogenase family)
MEYKKSVLITGGTSGIGKATAYELSRLGYNVTIVGQTVDKCTTVAETITHFTENSVQWIASDLSTLDGIRSTAVIFMQRNIELHILINNAGAFFNQRIITKDGFEKTFALNHLYFFYLTHLLLDQIKSSQSARIINVSSMAHASIRKLDFDNLQGEKYFSGWEAYSRSKLCDLLFTYELSQRFSENYITVNALHPGYVGTNFELNNGLVFKVFTSLGAKLLARKSEHGAQTCIYLATSTEVDGISGKYFFDCPEARSSDLSKNKTVREKLWQVSLDSIS